MTYGDEPDLHAECKERIAELRAERDRLQAENTRIENLLGAYKQSFESALYHVDSVFQVDSNRPPPLLPDFCKLGDDKFEAVVKLAKAYIALQFENAALEATCNSLAAENAELRARCERLERLYRAERERSMDEAIAERQLRHGFQWTDKRHCEFIDTWKAETERLAKGDDQ